MFGNVECLTLFLARSRCRHGRVTAVMGPSGAGKSTFVTTLAGKATYGVPTGKNKCGFCGMLAVYYNCWVQATCLSMGSRAR